MDAAANTPDDQASLWNGAAGRAWVGAQVLLDQVLEPFEALLVEAVSAEARGPVLDVGCGTGSTTLAVARLPEAKGGCTGIDISEPMLAAARARGERAGSTARFVRADAATSAFEPASFDMIISRFGVMFFEDPVRAFANLRRATRNDAALWFVAWRSAAENPFMTTAERAAAPLLSSLDGLAALPTRRADGPGQFAFADQHHVARLLEESGWTELEIRPLDVVCTLPECELVRYVTELGPVGRVLHGADERTRAHVGERIRPAFDPYVQGAEVRFTAACWVVGARSGGDHA